MESANQPSLGHIEVRNISKLYGEHDVHALTDVSIIIPKGSFVALTGPSGCGKSTLLNCIGGIEKPSAGEILIDERNIVPLAESELTLLRREKIGFVFQFFNLLSTLTVTENVQLPLELAGKLPRTEMSKRTSELLEQMGLAARANFYPAQLSGGEMQRTSIARAIIHRPQVILADEPTGNLDSANGQMVLELLRKLCSDRGETIIMATHSEEAAALCDLRVRMKDGRVFEQAGIS